MQNLLTANSGPCNGIVWVKNVKTLHLISKELKTKLCLPIKTFQLNFQGNVTVVITGKLPIPTTTTISSKRRAPVTDTKMQL